MIAQLKTDRVAQIMLVAVFIAAIFACGTTSFFTFKFIAPTTITPEPTPTKINSLSMLEFKDVSVNQSDDYITIIGVVQNNSPELCTFIKVRVEYLDIDGSLITFDTGNIEDLIGLRPGDSSPFKIMTRLPPGAPKPDRFSLSLSSLAGCIPPD